MVTLNREQQILENIRSVFDKEKEALAGRRVLLFGSRAAGTARLRSDFDIGIDGDRPLDPVSFQRLADRLDAIETLYRIDFVDMRSLPERFRNEALRKTEVLFE